MIAEIMLPLEGISPITRELSTKNQSGAELWGITDAIARATSNLQTICQCLASTEVDKVSIVTGHVSELDIAYAQGLLTWPKEIAQLLGLPGRQTDFRSVQHWHPA
jgi:hypothetical protein